jgi:hypothetical protein
LFWIAYAVVVFRNGQWEGWNAMQITLHEKYDPQVNQAKNLVKEQAPMSWVLLFESDRWSPIERVAIAFRGESFVGIASLAPHGEENNPQDPPAIEGIWVHPNFRGQADACGLTPALQLVQACVQEAQTRYGAQKVTIEGVSPAGLRLAKRAQALGWPLQVTGIGLVPLP